VRLRKAFALVLALLVTACEPPEVGPSSGDSHTNWLKSCDTDADCGSLSCRLGVCVPEEAPAQVELTVDLSTRRQTLVGFGAALSYMEDALAERSDRAALDQALFAGLGLDVLRLRNRYGEVADARLAREWSIVTSATESLGRRPLLLLTSWSPPAALKQNGSLLCKDGPENCTLRRGQDGRFDYAAFAQHWRRSLDAYARVGLVPDYVGIQSNPNWAPLPGAPAEACRFLPSESDSAPGYAEATSSVLTAIADLPAAPKLLAPELSSPDGAESYLQRLDTSRIAAIAHHLYGVSATRPEPGRLEALSRLRTASALPLFQTEMQAGGFDTALLMHRALVSEGASMYLQTMLVAPHSGPAANPNALVGLEEDGFVLNDAYFAMQHYALFTEPGDVRRDVTVSDARLLASAWSRDDSNALTLVLINAGSEELHVALELERPGAFTIARTSFDGVERMKQLGSVPTGTLLSLPQRSMATLRFEP
jgi:O-glycosyl hydrolase